jgi:hypothetical protein
VKNDRDAYTLNNITAKKNDDGSVTIQFGGCDAKSAIAYQSHRVGIIACTCIGRAKRFLMAHTSFPKHSR